MIRNYLKSSFRNFHKYKVFTLITVFGLTVAMTVCIILSAHIAGEHSYDKFWEDSENLFRISHSQYKNGVLQFESAKTYSALPLAMEKELPGIKHATGLRSDVITVYTPDEQIKDVKMYWTDTCVFKVLKCKAAYGSLENPFPDINSAVVSKSMASKLFGNENPIGKWFKLNEGWPYHVSAVFENIPSNSHLQADCFFDIKSAFYHMRNFDYTSRQIRSEPGALPQNTRNGNFRNNIAYVYVLLENKTTSSQVASQLPELIDKHAPNLKEARIVPKFKLQPITDIHLNSNLKNEIKANGDKDMVLALLVIASIIICIAWINFINLTLVRGIEQAKTTGLHKIIGAQRSHIFYQYLTENMLVNLISLGLSIVLVVLVKKMYYQLTGIHLSFMFQWEYYIYFSLAILCGILISGLYPAIFLSAFKPIQLFSQLKKSGGNTIDVRKTLVVIQFTATTILIVGTITVFKQINYMKTRKLGMNIEQTLVSFSPMSTIRKPDLIPTLNSFKNEIKKLASVNNVTTSSSIPGKEIEFRNDNVRKADAESDHLSETFYFLNTDHDFIKTYDLKLLAGSYYNKTNHPGQQEIVINEKAAGTLGFQSPLVAIGQPVKIGNTIFNILGVVANHHHETLRKSIVPLIFMHSYRWNHDVGYYSFKISSENIDNTIAEIEAVWKRFYPQDHFDFFFLDKSFDAQYKQYQMFGKLFGTFSLLAILIACSGLLGLAIYSATQRNKEIGIRKVNGAKISEILNMLNKDFIKWVVIAFIIACPIAYYAMNKWLENFAYKTSLSWWIFALAGVLALGIALLTVSWLSWKAATRNPVEALRYE